MEFGIKSNATSSGDMVDFDAAVVLSCTITNNSGVTVQYSTGGDFTSISNGSSASVGAFNAADFRIRHAASDSYPRVVSLTFEAADGVGLTATGGTTSLTAGSAVLALSEATTESLATASATTQILTGAGEYFAYRCTVAAGNITIYDNTASSGKVLVPTTALEVGTFPIYGAGIGRSVIVDNGIRVVLSGAATVYIGHMGY